MPHFGSQALALTRSAKRFALPEIEERHRSVRLALIGRFMRASKAEYPAKTTRISVAELSLATAVRPAEDERIIAYFEHVGGLEGVVSRIYEAGFDLRLNITTRKREKLAAQLTWLLNRGEIAGLEERRHERFAVGNKTLHILFEDGRSSACRILDISVSGASIETSLRPEIGSDILVGKQRAVVRRHHDQGIGVQFMQEQEADRLEGFLRG